MDPHEWVLPDRCNADQYPTLKDGTQYQFSLQGSTSVATGTGTRPPMPAMAAANY